MRIIIQNGIKINKKDLIEHSKDFSTKSLIAVFARFNTPNSFMGRYYNQYAGQYPELGLPKRYKGRKVIVVKVGESIYPIEKEDMYGAKIKAKSEEEFCERIFLHELGHYISKEGSIKLSEKECNGFAEKKLEEKPSIEKESFEEFVFGKEEKNVQGNTISISEGGKQEASGE